MPTATIVCSNCDRVITVAGPPPKVCPTCGCTLDNAADATHTHDRPPDLPETIIEALGLPPATYGRYEVIRKLGSGGFGTVYLAWDPKLKRHVAIKVPDVKKSKNPEAVERFAREGRNSAQLRHPNIVPIHTVEEDRGVVFIVSEYVDGEPLSRQLRKERLPVRTAASIVATVASAVNYAHSKGIIHRDIKPGNIMMDVAGNPRLMDFGLAKHEETDPTVTIEDQVIGTPAYMSPEQAKGKSKEIDRRTDVYSLGATLYHLLTNELPYRGNVREVRDKILAEEPKRPRAIDKQIPIDLETICLKAMEKEPARRYQTAAELADDLERWLRGEPVLARHISPLERSIRWCRRNPASAGTIASVALLLVALAVGSSLFAAVQASARRNSDNARKEIEEVLAKNQELLSRAYVEKGERYVRATEFSDEYNPIKSLPWLLEATKFDEGSPRRFVADRIRLQSQLDSAPRVERMWFFKGGLRSAGLSAKRDTFFVGGSDGYAHVWRIKDNHSPIVSLVHPAAVTAGEFSPDGRLLATVSKDGVRIWEVASGKLLKSPLMHQQRIPVNGQRSNVSEVGIIAFSKSGLLLLTTTIDGAIQIWQVKNGEPLAAPILTRLDIRSAEFADSERLAVVSCGDGSTRVYDVRSGAEKHLLRTSGENYTLSRVRADGITIASCSDSGTIVLWNAATGKRVGQPLVPDSRIPCRAATFSSDGQFLASASSDGVIRMWRTDDGRLLWRQHITSGWTDRLSFSPDQSQLAVVSFDDKKLCTVAVDSGKTLAQPINNLSRLCLANWAEDSPQIVTIDLDGVARLWNVENNVPAFLLPYAHGIKKAVVSDDRRVIATVDAENSCCVLRRAADDRFDATGLSTFRIGDLPIDSLCLSSDGSELAVSAGRSVLVWNALTQQLRAGPFVHSETVTQIRFGRNGTSLVCLSRDGMAVVWEIAASRKLYESVDVGKSFNDIDIDREGKRCAVAGMKGVTSWELASGHAVGPGLVARGFAKFARFLRNPRLMLVTFTNRPPRIWDISTGQPVQFISKHLNLTCVDVSDDSSLFLTGYEDGTARLWNSDNAVAASPVFEHRAAVMQGIIDPTRRWVATITADFTVRSSAADTHLCMWDVETGAMLADYPLAHFGMRFPSTERRAPRAGRILVLCFAPDGRALNCLTDEGLIISIRLRVENNSFDGVAEDVAIRSGTEVDGAGGLRILEPAELTARWQKFDKRSL